MPALSVEALRSEVEGRVRAAQAEIVVGAIESLCRLHVKGSSAKHRANGGPHCFCDMCLSIHLYVKKKRARHLALRSGMRYGVTRREVEAARKSFRATVENSSVLDLLPEKLLDLIVEKRKPKPKPKSAGVLVCPIPNNPITNLPTLRSNNGRRHAMTHSK